MYDFDMKQMLAAFDDDPEALASAFSNQLNKELAQRRSMQSLKNAAADVAVAWNDFVDEYFDVHKLPEGRDYEDFELLDNGECLIKLLDAFVKYNPDIEKWTAAMKKINETANKMTEKLNKENIKKMSESNLNNFDTVMNNFFDKMGW